MSSHQSFLLTCLPYPQSGIKLLDKWTYIDCTSLCGDILDFQIFLLFITGKLEILKEIATAKKELPKFYRTWAFLL